MKIVIDSNILFAALIANSGTRGLILGYGEKFLAPIHVFEEFEKYRGEILEKSGLGDEEFETLVGLIFSRVETVSARELASVAGEAIVKVKGIDEDDAMFVACALLHEGSVLWSNDKRLKDVKGVKVVSTGEISDYLDG